MLKEKLFHGYEIQCDVIQMGKDYTIALYGGGRPHVGCVVMSTARPSLSGVGIGVTSSVISGVGHKEEFVARQFAESLAKEKNCTVVCSCGIHIDNITAEQIDMIQKKCEKLIERILAGEAAALNT
ncbi:hypothetical protein H8S37_05685 [Mediterraneibacter sp. NSJ-55]|uniref:Prenylated flavin chaperone LpdD-like domain-containing protein n=1 Tax=Mediterraneibacter hominis TaxID=2763054 RepID=A0A923LGP5_9FIRM|nr:hypothetical protein [Mediterraneibacter hominis]MBC5688420.1 hypothetical protein [Mediterraneibacter hominis]